MAIRTNTIAPIGTPNNLPFAMLLKVSGKPVMAGPLVMINASPEYNCNPQRVTNIAGISKNPIMNPLKRPHRLPTRTAATMPIPMERFVPPILSIRTAATIPDKFAIPTKERSIPPAIMAIIIPNAKIPYSGN